MGGSAGEGCQEGASRMLQRRANWVAIVYGREVSLPTLQFDSGRGGYGSSVYHFNAAFLPG